MKQKYILFFLLLVLGSMSCKKDWLDVKSDKALVVPSELRDFQALLDNNSFVFNGGQPSLQEISSGDFYIPFDSWQNVPKMQQNAYVWASNVYEGAPIQDWNLPYQQIFYANVALEGISSITPDEASIPAWNNIKGSALFFRAFAFYNLLQLFAKPYEQDIAVSAPGIPLKLSSDINAKSTRATLQESYDQVINDLKIAAPLLSISLPNRIRPSRPGAFALLARVYLSMNNFENALLYADSCLSLTNTLVDYNSIDTTATNSFPIFNNEVLFHSPLSFYFPSFFFTTLTPDSLLYKSYAPDDLRLSVFFRYNNGIPRYKGSYAGSILLFGGLAIDEMYLIRSECYAHKGNLTEAMNDLNTLLEQRFKTGFFTPLSAADTEEALQIILAERRKELIFRGLRWTDLRRLNSNPALATTLNRMVGTDSYSLPPNSDKYVFAIPDVEIEISGIEQNPR